MTCSRPGVGSADTAAQPRKLGVLRNFDCSPPGFGEPRWRDETLVACKNGLVMEGAVSKGKVQQDRRYDTTPQKYERLQGWIVRCAYRCVSPLSCLSNISFMLEGPVIRIFLKELIGD
ncbi:hypothetical protein EYC80_006045 [Monilinia laxa]|uniref:Uncharacterized protein n=1 Tax=Monilinia laxa TaxID=61186 RepID=A0A5N6KFZ6_MONLA|nr:hypothetical protein EYC80_006045 [Monilinia laxa]